MHIGNGLIAVAVAGFTIVAAGLKTRAIQAAPGAGLKTCATTSVAGAGLKTCATTVEVQPPPQTPPPGGRGRIGETFPAQQRPPGDPLVIERGKTLYGINCASCHGHDARGGELGGSNLLRSQLVLNDQAGELILPTVRGSLEGKGMPAINMNDEDVKAVAEFIHSLTAAGRGQGAPPPGTAPPPDVLVGDATAGQAYFGAKCSACHSATGDLQGVAARMPNAKALQNLWVSGGAGGGRGGGRQGGGAPGRRITTVTVTVSASEKIEGRLLRIDDFIVTLAQDDGTVRSFRRDGDRPAVEVHDPLDGHKALLAVLTDKDMHDVTAYLATLK